MRRIASGIAREVRLIGDRAVREVASCGVRHFIESKESKQDYGGEYEKRLHLQTVLGDTTSHDQSMNEPLRGTNIKQEYDNVSTIVVLVVSKEIWQ